MVLCTQVVGIMQQNQDNGTKFSSNFEDHYLAYDSVQCILLYGPLFAAFQLHLLSACIFSSIYTANTDIVFVLFLCLYFVCIYDYIVFVSVLALCLYLLCIYSSIMFAL